MPSLLPGYEYPDCAKASCASAVALAQALGAGDLNLNPI